METTENMEVTENTEKKGKSGIFIYVVLVFLVAFGIFCAIFFAKASYTTFIEEHTGLNLVGKYSKEEIEERNSGTVVGRYYIDEDEVDKVRSYIKDNWKDGMSEVDKGIASNGKTYIDEDLTEDAKYITAYSFTWTPEKSNETAEIWAYVADKPDEMYIAFAGIE